MAVREPKHLYSFKAKLYENPECIGQKRTVYIRNVKLENIERQKGLNVLEKEVDINIAVYQKPKKRALCSLLNYYLPSVAIVSVAVISLLFSGSSAIRTSLGFVFEALFLVEILFTLCKNKFVVAILAN